MVSGTDTIKLELVIDREDLERQLGEALTPSAPPSAGGGGGTGVQRTQRVEPGREMKQALGFLTKLTGISLSITALVRSSQVMSTSVSALNTVLGAMVDSFLIPFLPMMTDLVSSMSQFIGEAGKAGRATKGRTDTLGMLMDEEVPGDTKRAIGIEMGRRALDFAQLMGKSMMESQANRSLRDPTSFIPGIQAVKNFPDVLGEVNRRSEERTSLAAPAARAMREADPETQARLVGILAQRQQQVEARGNTYNISIFGAEIEEAVAKTRSALEESQRNNFNRIPGGR